VGLEKINLFRKEKGLSVEDLSILSSIPMGTLSKITAGITKNPNLETVKAIMTALGKTIDDLYDSPENNKLKKINDSFDYFIERQMLLLGYEVFFDPEDGNVLLTGKEGVFEITEVALDDLRNCIPIHVVNHMEEMQ